MNDRRYDLDWLRIIALGILILYHVGMFYVTWSWHVKSSRASDAVEPLMLLVNPWRLTLLFLISGAATRFLADRVTAWKLASARMLRLCPPLLLAIFAIVPPQSYYEVVEALQEMQGQGPIGPPQTLWLQGFYLKYVTASGAWCDHDGCLITPTYNHMWFVAYLIIYTLALVPLLPVLLRLPAATSALISGPWLVVTPWVFMFVLRVTLFPMFGESHYFWQDWYLHALYFSTFLFGFAIAKYQPFFERSAHLRWTALVISLVAWAMLTTYLSRTWGEGARPPSWLRTMFRGVHELQAWTAIIAAVGFAHHYLRSAESLIRRRLTQAIFPFYLAHQTIIIVAGHHLDKLHLPLATEVPLLVGITMLGCWLFFEIGRRVPVFRVWIGLSRGGSDAQR